MTETAPAATEQPMDWATLLTEIRDQRAAQTPDFDWAPDDDDSLACEIHERRRELAGAPIVWAEVIMGSRRLLAAHETGQSGGTAHLILSFDPRVDAAPSILEYVAHRIMLVWESDSATRSPLGRWCGRLRDGSLQRERPLLRVPDALTNGYAVFIAPTTVVTAHLPGGRMRFERLPVFAERQPDGWAMPVPAALWPARLRAWWLRAPVG